MSMFQTARSMECSTATTAFIGPRRGARRRSCRARSRCPWSGTRTAPRSRGHGLEIAVAGSGLGRLDPTGRFVRIRVRCRPRRPGARRWERSGACRIPVSATTISATVVEKPGILIGQGNQQQQKGSIASSIRTGEPVGYRRVWARRSSVEEQPGHERMVGGGRSDRSGPRSMPGNLNTSRRRFARSAMTGRVVLAPVMRASRIERPDTPLIV